MPVEMAGTEDSALCMYLTRVIYPLIYVQALFARAAEPLKMVGMMAFMMWMSGSQLHIFSIMTTLSGVYQPLMAILNSGQGAPPERRAPISCVCVRLLRVCRGTANGAALLRIPQVICSAPPRQQPPWPGGYGQGL